MPHINTRNTLRVATGIVRAHGIHLTPIDSMYLQMLYVSHAELGLLFGSIFFWLLLIIQLQYSRTEVSYFFS